MIPALSPHSASAKKIFNFKGYNLTEAKTKQIAFAFFTVLSFTLGCLALSIGGSASFFFAIPCFIASGVILWMLSLIKDYQDPSALAKMRKAAAKQSLVMIIKEHGWEKMMQFGIPEPKLFYEKCIDTMKGLPIMELIKFYELAVQMKEDYQAAEINIPKPIQFKEKFLIETKNMTACQMFEKYDFQLLNNYGFISSALFKASEQYRIAENGYQVFKQSKNRTFSEFCQAELRKFKGILDLTTGTGKEQIHWLAQLNREVAYLSNLSGEDWFKGTLEIFTEIHPQKKENWKDLSHTLEALDAFQKATSAAKTKRDAEVTEMHQQFVSRCNLLNQQFRTAL